MAKVIPEENKHLIYQISSALSFYLIRSCGQQTRLARAQGLTTSNMREYGIKRLPMKPYAKFGAANTSE
jgi:hypothetical protein